MYVHVDCNKVGVFGTFFEMQEKVWLTLGKMEFSSQEFTLDIIEFCNFCTPQIKRRSAVTGQKYGNKLE